MDTAQPQPILILYADGRIEIPGAQTYGQALGVMAIIERAAQGLRDKALAQPLQVAPIQAAA